MEKSELETQLAELLNRHSAENGSDTPDYILAQMLIAVLTAWNVATKDRDRWFGFSPFSSQATRNIP